MQYFALFFVIVLVGSFASEVPDLKNFLEHVPQEDRRDFLKYSLERGFKIFRTKNFQSLTETEGSLDFPLPSDTFCVALYEYVVNNQKVTINSAIANFNPADQICFDDGSCIDIGDVGIHPDKA